MFSGQTLSSLGLTPGTYSFKLPNDTVTGRIGAAPAAVPEPSSVASMGLGSLGLLGLLLRARKRRLTRWQDPPPRGSSNTVRRHDGGGPFIACAALRGGCGVHPRRAAD